MACAIQSLAAYRKTDITPYTLEENLQAGHIAREDFDVFAVNWATSAVPVVFYTNGSEEGHFDYDICRDQRY